MRRNKNKDKQGFTLVEIMFAIMIIGILLVIAFPNFAHARKAAQKRSCIGNLRRIEWAKDQWAISNSKPTSATPLASDLAGSFKFLVDLPTCPTDDSPYTINRVDTSPECTYLGGTVHKITDM